MITCDEYEKFIFSNFPYEQRIISIIDEFGRQIFLDNLGHLYSNYGKTVKLESMEKFNFSIYNYCNYLKKMYNHNGPVTCHLFKSYQNSKSFDLHSDPDDVFLYVVSGQKDVIFDNEQSITLKSGESFFIPSGKKHKAINRQESLMLSFGLEKFFMDKL